MKRFLIPAILIAVSIAVYLPALNYDFVYDDPRQIEMMSSRFTWSHVPSYFTTDVWSYINQRKSNYYRPIFLVWMLLTHELAGLDHAAWHASAILTNALAVLLLYFLARKLAGNEITAAIAALLFAVHPVHIESVAWVSGATEPLWAIFFFAALLLFISARVEPEAGGGGIPDHDPAQRAGRDAAARPDDERYAGGRRGRVCPHPFRQRLCRAGDEGRGCGRPLSAFIPFQADAWRSTSR